MAKKVFQNRFKKASLCAVYEDISDNEFDPTEMQIVVKPFNYNPPPFAYNYLSSSSSQIQQNVNFLSAPQNRNQVFVPPCPFYPPYVLGTFDKALGWEEANAIISNDDDAPDTSEENGSWKYEVKKEPGEKFESVKEESMDYQIKKEPLTDEEESETDDLSGQPQFDDISESEDSKVSVDEELLLEWSDISEDEKHEDVHNDYPINLTGWKSSYLKICQNVFQKSPTNVDETLEPGTNMVGSSVNLFQRITDDSSDSSEKISNSTESSFLKDLNDDEKTPKSMPSIFHKISTLVNTSGAMSIDNISCSSQNVFQKIQNLADTPSNYDEQICRSPHPGGPGHLLCKETPSFITAKKTFQSKNNILKLSVKSNLEENITSSSTSSSTHYCVKQKDKGSTNKKSSPRKVNPRKVQLFACPQCTRKYWKESKLSEHMRLHHTHKTQKADSDRYEVSRCPECKEQLKTKTEMYVHRLTHLLPDFQKMKCPLCGNDQHTFEGLKRHVISAHNLLQKWFCPICPGARTFTQNNSLLTHISTFHFDSAKDAPRQYSCMKCNEQFGSKALLGRHVNDTHMKDLIYKCDACGKSYEKFPQLRNHMKSRHMNNPVSGQANDAGKSDKFGAKLKKLKQSLLNKPLSAKFLPKVGT